MFSTIIDKKNGLVFCRSLCVFLLFALAVTSIEAASRDPLNTRIPKATIPDGAQAQWIAEKMALNGLAMSIRHFRYAGNIEQVRSFYADSWGRLGCPVLTQLNQSPGHMLGCETNGFYLSVRLVETDHGVEGVVTVSELPTSATVNRKTKFPKLNTTQVIQKVESKDINNVAETLLLTSPDSLETNMNYVDEQLIQMGWVAEDVAETVNYTDSSVTKIYKRKNQIVQIVYTPKNVNLGGTEMWVNWVK